VNIYVAGIAFILVLALAMSLFIMGDTEHLPQIVCRLSDDAREVVLLNQGNDRAVQIHVTLVPLDREFDIPEIAPDGRASLPLPGMVAEAKALVRYENTGGRKFSRSFQLSATGEEDEDLLKPMFPLFGWK
jgi:hypothetical protein